MNVWNATVDYPPGAHLCRAPSPTVFAYPAACAVRALGNRSFEGAADRWTEGKDDLSAAGSYNKYHGGVLLPDGRVVLVPRDAKHVGLYDPSKDQWTEGKDDLSAAGSDKYFGGVLLPNGRVVLVPYNAKHVGLYDAGGTRNGAAYTIPPIPDACNALLLPYYNKL